MRSTRLVPALPSSPSLAAGQGSLTLRPPPPLLLLPPPPPRVRPGGRAARGHVKRQRPVGAEPSSSREAAAAGRGGPAVGIMATSNLLKVRAEPGRVLREEGGGGGPAGGRTGQGGGDGGRARVGPRVPLAGVAAPGAPPQVSGLGLPASARPGPAGGCCCLLPAPRSLPPALPSQTRPVGKQRCVVRIDRARCLLFVYLRKSGCTENEF